MIVVFSMAATIWLIGVAMKTPLQARLMMLGLLFVGVLAIHVVLPDGHPLREGTGGSAALWLIIAAAGGLAYGYSRIIKGLRERAAPVETPMQRVQRTETMGDVELERYARHIVLREIGGPGQSKLKRAKVLVVGAGGLGSPVLQYLSAAGVGTIGIIDDDKVEHTNLQRQTLHTDAATGMNKTASAEQSIHALNPYVVVKPYTRRLTEEIAEDLFDDYDLIIDGVDNQDTRRLINRTAVKLGLPVVHGAITQWEGQVAIWDPSFGGPCYNCIFPEDPAPGQALSCAEAGVLGPLPGMVGTMMAAEAIKRITGAGTPLIGSMMMMDALDAETRKIKVKRRADCAVCGKAKQ
ncbi:MAG: HesA/MoeB/ThiF family protein [Rhodobacteraceae bacterium]|nr:HesA/MoeB/ThiF family protein [Paracoccaceae bacterium]